MVRPMVHSKKHYVQKSIATVTGGVVDSTNIIVAVEGQSIGAVHEVTEGSTVKACYVEMWARSGSATPASGQMIIYKRGSDSSGPSATDMAALGDWDNKKNILYTTMGLINDNDADAIALFKGWVKIPKSKQRFGLGDRLAMAVFTPTVDFQVCGMFIYKEYT